MNQPKDAPSKVVLFATMGFLETPTDEPRSGSQIRARWGMVAAMVPVLYVLLFLLVYPTANEVFFAPVMAFLGVLLGLLVWDAPRMPADLRKYAPFMGAIAFVFLFFFLDGTESKKALAAVGPAKPYIGLILFAGGLIWHAFGRASSGFFVTAGAGFVLVAGGISSQTAWWPLVPVFLASYLPLFRWQESDGFLRAGGLLAHILTLVLMHDALPVNALGNSWALFALPILYALTMLFVHLLGDRDRRIFNRWLAGLVVVTLYLASTSGQVWLRWLPVQEFLIVLVALGALYSVVAARGQMAIRWLVVVIALAHAALAVSTLVGRIRLNDPVWESIVLFLFAVGLAALAIRSGPLEWRLPAKATDSNGA